MAFAVGSRGLEAIGGIGVSGGGEAVTIRFWCKAGNWSLPTCYESSESLARTLATQYDH